MRGSYRHHRYTCTCLWVERLPGHSNNATSRICHRSFFSSWSWATWRHCRSAILEGWLMDLVWWLHWQCRECTCRSMILLRSRTCLPWARGIFCKIIAVFWERLEQFWCRYRCKMGRRWLKILLQLDFRKTTCLILGSMNKDSWLKRNS